MQVGLRACRRTHGCGGPRCGRWPALARCPRSPGSRPCHASPVARHADRSAARAAARGLRGINGLRPARAGPLHLIHVPLATALAGGARGAARRPTNAGQAPAQQPGFLRGSNSHERLARNLGQGAGLPIRHRCRAERKGTQCEHSGVYGKLPCGPNMVAAGMRASRREAVESFQIVPTTDGARHEGLEGNAVEQGRRPGALAVQGASPKRRRRAVSDRRRRAWPA